MLGTCDVELRDQATGECRPLYFEAGVGAVEVLECGALRPAAIWRARQGRSWRAELIDSNARLHALIDRVVVAYQTTAGDPPMDAHGRQLPPEDPLSVLYGRLGSAVMGDVQLLPYARGENAVVLVMKFREEEDFLELQPVFSLADGSVLARSAYGWARADPARISPPPPAPIDLANLADTYLDVEYARLDASEVPIVARSLEQVLDWILAPIGALPVLGTVQSVLDERGPADANRVNLHEAYEVEHWTKKFDCTKAELEAAVKKVGAMAKDVETELKKK